LETVAVFVDGWTVEAAAQVAGMDEDRALTLLEALARQSLIYLDSTERGPRLRMLETIRAFVAERLGARPDLPRAGGAAGGAAEGLRRRVGLRAWPMVRRGEAELVDQARHALGADRFDQMFAAGARLTQRAAVAAVHDRRGTGTRAS
jgi:hypothetical protein